MTEWRPIPGYEDLYAVSSEGRVKRTRGGRMMAMTQTLERQPRELPILFSAPMVRAILAGQKTVTRRIVAEPKAAKLHGRRSLPDRNFFDRGFGDGVYLHWFYGGGDLGDDAQAVRVPARWNAGDRLWVKETHGLTTGNGIRTVYRADAEQPVGLDGNPVVGKMTWRPSIFMRRADSRITLEVTDVRGERLQEISQEEVVAEGVKIFSPAFPRADFMALWDSINGGPWKCWADNPWVWRVEFRRVKP